MRKFLFLCCWFSNVLAAPESGDVLFGLESFTAEPKAVSNLDIDRYMGKWFEIARLPTYFEQRCLAPIVVNYQRNLDVIEVNNSCMTVAGSISTYYEGVMYISDENLHGSGKFAATSLPAWLRWTHLWRSDYWVLYSDYGYSLIGTPDHNYLWLLARNENPPLKVIQEMIVLAKEQGFILDQLIFNYPSYFAP